ncbi:MAG: hypothetical protein IT451_11715 [Candidatus Brocadia sp.]|nr:hypothetical protein [Candidatus Brocadia sp.]
MKRIHQINNTAKTQRMQRGMRNDWWIRRYKTIALIHPTRVALWYPRNDAVMWGV